MSLLVWIIVGGIAGWLASKVVGTDADQGIFLNIIVGILGAFVGGTLYTLFTTGTFDINSAISGFNFGSFILATLGAIVLLMVIKAFMRTNTKL